MQNKHQQVFASKQQVNRTLSPFAVMVARLAQVKSAPQHSSVTSAPDTPIFLDGDQQPDRPSHAALQLR